MPPRSFAEFLPVLVQARKTRHLSQNYVAAKLGVTGPAVTLWETGRRNPTRENAERWANLLGVPFPDDASTWFARDRVAKEQQHGTRSGYQWHQRHRDMPACEPCQAAAAAEMASRRQRKTADGK